MATLDEVLGGLKTMIGDLAVVDQDAGVVIGVEEIADYAEMQIMSADLGLVIRLQMVVIETIADLGAASRAKIDILEDRALLDALLLPDRERFADAAKLWWAESLPG